MDEVIAHLSLVGITSDGRQLAIEVRVGKPRPDDRCWVCPVAVLGVDSRPRNICGDESFQALTLGLRFVASELWLFVETGGQLLDSINREPFPLEAYFPQAERAVLLASWAESPPEPPPSNA